MRQRGARALFGSNLACCNASRLPGHPCASLAPPAVGAGKTALLEGLSDGWPPGAGEGAGAGAGAGGTRVQVLNSDRMKAEGTGKGYQASRCGPRAPALWPRLEHPLLGNAVPAPLSHGLLPPPLLLTLPMPLPARSTSTQLLAPGRRGGGELRRRRPRARRVCRQKPHPRPKGQRAARGRGAQALGWVPLAAHWTGAGALCLGAPSPRPHPLPHFMPKTRLRPARQAPRRSPSCSPAAAPARTPTCSAACPTYPSPWSGSRCACCAQRCAQSTRAASTAVSSAGGRSRAPCRLLQPLPPERPCSPRPCF
jgi:hypothetical protein